MAVEGVYGKIAYAGVASTEAVKSIVGVNPAFFSKALAITTLSFAIYTAYGRIDYCLTDPKTHACISGAEITRSLAITNLRNARPPKLLPIESVDRAVYVKDVYEKRQQDRADESHGKRLWDGMVILLAGGVALYTLIPGRENP